VPKEINSNYSEQKENKEKKFRSFHGGGVGVISNVLSNAF
jgi:hypothetical protein